MVMAQPPVQHGRSDDVFGDAAWARLLDRHAVLIRMARRYGKSQEGARRAQTWPFSEVT